MRFNEDVYFLTIVQDGHVSLTSIIAESMREAEIETYSHFTNLLGREMSWKMSDVRYSRAESLAIINWELENKNGSWIKASLIKA